MLSFLTLQVVIIASVKTLYIYTALYNDEYIYTSFFFLFYIIICYLDCHRAKAQ